MDKSKLNFIIDASMFLILMAMAGLGFLMKYTLPPGRVLMATSGSNPYLTWLGWDRHDWGDIHLYLAFILLSLLAIHLFLHWQQILGLFRRLIPDSRQRYRIAIIFLIISLLLIYFPFFITPDMQPRGRGGGGRHRSQLNASETWVAKSPPPGSVGAGSRSTAK
ncbi:MAG: DUF4405 domain-containing protein [Deltaproteobacteria bacterium]|jgi:hypothetical protein